MRQVLQEGSWKSDGLQLGQLRFLDGRQVVLPEDLVLGSQGAEEREQPTFVRYVRFVDSVVHELLITAHLVELLEQHIHVWWARAGKISGLRVL